jgi:hypothetical protein
MPSIVDQFDPGLVIMSQFSKVRSRLFGLLRSDVKTDLAHYLDSNILIVR